MNSHLITSTWRLLLEDAVSSTEYPGATVLSTNMKRADFDRPFENGYGSDPSKDVGHLMAWTTDNVYFSHDYDGLKTVRSVPRNPPE